MNTLEYYKERMEFLIDLAGQNNFFLLITNIDKVREILNNYKKHEFDSGYRPILAIGLEGLLPEVKSGK